MAGLVFGHTKKFHMYTRIYFKYPIGYNFLFYRLVYSFVDSNSSSRLAMRAKNYFYVLVLLIVGLI